MPLQSEREQPKRVPRLLHEKWLQPRPESSLDCLMCAVFGAVHHTKHRDMPRYPSPSLSGLDLSGTNVYEPFPFFFLMTLQPRVEWYKRL